MSEKNEEIIVDVNPEGNVEVRVEGVSGPGCLKLTEDLEKFLGRLLKRQKTREYERSRVRPKVVGKQ